MILAVASEELLHEAAVLEAWYQASQRCPHQEDGRTVGRNSFIAEGDLRNEKCLSNEHERRQIWIYDYSETVGGVQNSKNRLEH
jgi:hypothetical protein